MNSLNLSADHSCPTMGECTAGSDGQGVGVGVVYLEQYRIHTAIPFGLAGIRGYVLLNG